MSTKDKAARDKAARESRATESREIAMYSNEPDHDEPPIRAGSEEEIEEFQSHVELGLKPEEVHEYGARSRREAYRKRYAKYLSKLGIDPATLVKKF